MVYRGYEVLADPLLMPSQTMRRTFERPMEELDPGPGDWHIKETSNHPFVTTEHKWVFKTPQQAWEFRKWLHRQAGRLSPIWIPSRMDDLVLSAVPEAYSTAISIHAVNYQLNVQGLRHIAMFFPSGEFICANVTAVSEGLPGEEILELDLELPENAADIFRISFISLHRFAADRIAITWERPGVGICAASMVSLGFARGAGESVTPPPAGT